ncbi:MAG: methionine gamma-lyase family protein, partial [Clostridia bacterium]|nr:methionine gamma-lyase family protein [Clostridia bacterium]
LIAFCQGLQSGSPIDSHVTPYPWAMPGYSDEVIMAAGAFNQGSSIELSADGPITEPYIAYMQGGLTFESGYLGVLKSVQKLKDSKLINL